MIVTIDGPAGAGKTTVARAVAAGLGVRYLDTGAMYRAAAWKALRERIPLQDEARLAAMVRASRIELEGTRVSIDGEDVSDRIRSEEVSQAASIVSAHAPVRAALVEHQRAIGRRGSLVTEGRDQGSVVFPDAEHKFFLTASIEERARRRHREVGGDPSQVRREMSRRDDRDRTRAASPLVLPDGAVQIDTTSLSVEQVVEKILEKVGRGRRLDSSDPEG